MQPVDIVTSHQEDVLVFIVTHVPTILVAAIGRNILTVYNLLSLEVYLHNLVKVCICKGCA